MDGLAAAAVLVVGAVAGAVGDGSDDDLLFKHNITV